MLNTLLVELTGGDEDRAEAAVPALIALGADAMPALLGVVKDARQSARIQAMRALAEIRDQRAIPAMMQVMDEK